MRIAAITAAVIFVLDQLSKYAIVQGLNLIERGVIDVWPPLLTFRMAWNRGINFGLFAHDAEIMRWVLIAVALVISGWVWLWIRREGDIAIFAGAIGLILFTGGDGKGKVRHKG